ncbi:MAG: class A beta-lactamase-related serine hydrolase [Chloroflexi bacterium]|nr:class A beta-lactamase-related serine hydrolase [Chloroflexota bacterium]
MASVAGREPGVATGVVVMDLATGERCAINADRTYRSASLYKLVVVAELYRQVEEGIVDLEQPLVVEPRHAIDDPPDFRITSPYTTSVYGAAERMITFSDNATAFALRELLGVGEVDAATDWLGMPATSLGATFLTSANDQAEYLRRAYAGEIVNTEASAAIVDLMLQQEIVDMIPRGLPAGVPVAHKTGTLDTFLHDAAIVFAPGGDYVLVVLTEHTSMVTAMEVMQEVARTTHEAYAEASLAQEIAALIAESAALMEVNRWPESAVSAVVTPVIPASDAPTAAPPQMVMLDERVDSFSLTGTLSDALTSPVALAVLMLAATFMIAGPVWMLRRRPAVRYGDAVLSPQDARLRADRSERGLVMRFGSRRDDESRPNPPTLASFSVSEVSEQPVLPSRRLQRLAEHFRAQGDLLGTMRDEFEDEMEPLHELIVHQAQAMQSLLQNLEERLRPLNEYADGEEANLVAL